jgi:hypothetical protein
MKSFLKNSALGFVAVIALSACSQDQKEQLGLVKTAPDEFTVVTRAPLSVPPEYSIRPPRPGVARPMETSTREQAKQTLFGVEDVNANQGSQGNPEFLEKVGVSDADPTIRERLTDENRTYVQENKPVAEKLMFWDDSVVQDDILDPKEELERINKAAPTNLSADATSDVTAE